MGEPYNLDGRWKVKIEEELGRELTQSAFTVFLLSFTSLASLVAYLAAPSSEQSGIFAALLFIFAASGSLSFRVWSTRRRYAIRRVIGSLKSGS